MLRFHWTMDRTTSFCLISHYLDPPPPYHMQIHRTASFLLSYPLSLSSPIDPCAILWRFAYPSISGCCLIMYDTSIHKAVVL